jgi:uncharacterized protein YegL
METPFGKEVLLFYIVCDESGSMGPNGGINAINQALPELHSTLAADPLVVDKSRLAIIAFSDTAELILPLSKVAEVADMPGVAEQGMTNYGLAFSLLRQTIEQDVAGMKSQGFRVFRPCVFFMSDGEPSDQWESEYQALINHAYRPHIVAFGVDGADPGILAKIATLRCYVGRDKASAGSALANVMTSIGNTIISSTSNIGSGPVNIDLPPTIEGFDSIALDVL